LIASVSYISIRIYRAYNLFFPSKFEDQQWYASMNSDEYLIYQKIKNLYEHRDISPVLKLVHIDPSDIKFNITTNKSIYSKNDLISAAIVVKNLSNHQLILFSPRLKKLTPFSYNHEGFITDLFMIDCSPSDKYHCHIIEPSSTASFPISIDIPDKELGKHQVTFSFMTPVSNGQKTIATSSPTFEVSE
jgi:hypothetical protein